MHILKLNAFQIVLAHNLDIVIKYLLKAIRVSTPVSCENLLRALATVLYENGSHVDQVCY